MRVRNLLMLAGIMAAMIPRPCHAEYYRYVDPKGILHYTDNPAEVPAAYRHTVQKYGIPDEASTPAPGNEASLNANARPQQAPEAGSSQEAAPPGNTPFGGPKPGPGSLDNKLAATGPKANPGTPVAKNGPQQKNPILAEIADLKNMEHDLNAVHDKLQQEQARLDATRKAAKSREDILKYNLAVAEFNKRAYAYEQKRAIYEEKTKALSAALEAQ